jgi:hypothetical protein
MSGAQYASLGQLPLHAGALEDPHEVPVGAQLHEPEVFMQVWPVGHRPRHCGAPVTAPHEYDTHSHAPPPKTSVHA